MIKNIIFDIGNVLTDFVPEEFYAGFGFSPEMVKRIVRATVMNPDWNEYDLGNISDEEILQKFIDFDPEIEKEIRTALDNCHGMVLPVDHAIPWIDGLKAEGYHVYCLSNFSEKMRRESADALTFLPHLDGGIISCDCHVTKPDPKIYRILLEKYDLNPDESVFIDDLAPNIEAAAAQGIHTIRFIDYEDANAKLRRLLEEQN